MISIRYKFLAIIVTLVVGTMLTYLTLAVRLFEADKEAYIFDSNVAVADALATETETLLAGITQTLGSIANLATDGTLPATEREHLVSLLFDGDQDLVDLAVYHITDNGIGQPFIDRTKKDYLDLHEVDREAVLKLRAGIKIDPSAMAEGKAQLQNTLLPGGIPLITIALKAGTEKDSGRGAILMLAEVQHDRLLKVFARPQMHTVFLIDGYGNLLAHPDAAKVAAKENIADPEFVASILANPLKTGAKEFVAADGKPWMSAFSKIDAGNLVVISKISREDAFAATQRLVKKSILFAIGLVIVAFLVSILFSRSLTTPLQRLFEATKAIASGDFGIRVKATTKDEVGSLTTSFNVMAGKIVALMGEVRDKARMEKELETARVVQENLFPPSESSDSQFLLAGFYAPASECGGDWWGYFRKGNFLYILIGDATGHGVPAALITAAAQSCCTTIQQIHARYPEYSLTPAAIMADLNAAIHHAAKGGMNMTFFIGMIDLISGELTYVNASHEMPIVCSPAGNGSAEINMLIGDPGPCLGESLSSVYPEHKIQLAPNDTIIWYTDGLVETRNAEEVEWGERRFLKVLKASADAPPEGLRNNLIAEAKAFSGGYPADDDITYVIVRWKMALPPSATV